MRILVIPDTQVKPSVPTQHLRWVSRAIRDYRPDHVIHMGDHWDFPSLSTYSSRSEVEGKRVLEDIEAGNRGMDLLLSSVKRMKNPPTLSFAFGNHENRCNRFVNDHPALTGILGPHLLNLSSWKTYPFLQPFEVGGIWFSHYFYQQNTGRAYGGTCHNILRNVGLSFVQGHRQGKDLASRTLPNGQVQRGLVVGSCYLHHEGYLGPQAKETWTGVCILNDVEDGDYDLMELSLRYLCRKYEGVELQEFLDESDSV